MRTFLPVIFVVASIIVVYMYGYPQYQKVDELQVKEDTYNVALSQLEKIEMLKAQNMERLSTITESDMIRLNTMTRVESEPLLVTLYLENLASEQGVTLTSLSTGQAAGGNPARASAARNPSSGEAETPRTTAGLTPFTTTLSFSSDFETFLAFIEAIETNLEVSDITSLSVSTSGGGGEGEGQSGAGGYSFSISFQTYLST